MLYIDLKYAKMMSLSLMTERGRDTFNFRCPLCGDSKKSSSKKRGWLIPNKKDNKKLYFYCHNCNAAMPFNAFLKEMNLSLWKAYKNECMAEDMESYKNSNFSTQTISTSEEKLKEIRSEIRFKNISNIQDFSIAIDYMEKRNIHIKQLSDPRFKNIMFTENYKKWINENYIENKYPIISNPDPRIVFPIFNKDGRFIGSQGRSLDSININMRYLTNKFIPDEELLYGIDSVDPNKTIFVVEGIFDALSIKNSMAMLTSWTDPGFIRRQFPNSKIIFIFDNEKRNIQIRKNYERLANMEDFGMMIWGREKCKDLNEMSIKNNLTQNQLTKIVEYNSFYGALNKKLRLAMWLSN